MIAFLNHFFFDEAPRAAFVYAAVMFLSSLALGRALGRRWIDGAALGYLILIGATNTAMFVAQRLSLPFVWFGLLSGGCVFAIAGWLRVYVFRVPATRDEGWLLVFPVAALFLLVWLVYVIPPYPAAGFDMFQAWFPEYARAAAIHGRLLLEDDMGFGHGLLAYAGLYYAPNTLGPTILAAWLGLGVDGLYPHYLGASALAAFLALAVLADLLRHRPGALLLYVVLCIAFFRLSGHVRLVLGNPWYDTVLPLAGAVATRHLVSAPMRPEALFHVAAVAAFMVFGRNYGAFFAAVLSLGLFVAYRAMTGEWKVGRWAAIAVLQAVLAAKEITQVITHGLYFPRAGSAGSLPKWANLIGGTLEDWLMTPTDWGLVIPKFGAVPVGPIFLAGAAVLLWRARGTGGMMDWRKAWLVLAPWIVLVLPVLLEGATGYRRAAPSKPYLVAVAFIPWYGAWLFAQAGIEERLALWTRLHRRRFALAAALVVVGATIPFAAWVVERPLWKEGAGAYFGRATGTYLANNWDHQMMQELVRRNLAETVRPRPIVYFYYEPGISLRYFLGGDFFADLDFWSEPVKKAAVEARDLGDLVARLGYPSLYISYPTFMGMASIDGDDSRLARFLPELKVLGNKPWIQARVTALEGVLLVTGPPRDGLKSSESP